jgi:hypothetical protein
VSSTDSPTAGEQEYYENTSTYWTTGPDCDVSIHPSTRTFFEWVEQRISKVPVGGERTIFEMRRESTEGVNLNIDVVISRALGG